MEGRVGILFGAVALIGTILLVRAGLDTHNHINRCADTSHGDYIWDDTQRRAACGQ